MITANLSRKALVAVLESDSAARMAAGMLEDNGIVCSFADSVMNRIYPLGNVNPNFGVRLFVAESDLERARQLLEEHGDI